MAKFYAVQHGDNYDWDNGSDNYEAAAEMASKMTCNEDYDGQEIRIAVIDTDTEYCEEEIIIRNGYRG